MAWIWRTLGLLGGLIVVLIGAGALLPKAHVAARSAVIPRPPQEIWKALVDVEASPAWRPDIVKVERLEDRFGNLTWRETYRHGRGVTFEATESIEPARQVRTIIERNLPYGGNWEIEVAAAPGGATVKITEHGEIYNPLFRLAARTFFGYTRAIDDFLRNLGRKYDATVTPGAA